jgi:hypothetical protein
MARLTRVTVEATARQYLAAHVHDLAGLRGVDASVLPTINRGHPQAPWWRSPNGPAS